MLGLRRYTFLLTCAAGLLAVLVYTYCGTPAGMALLLPEAGSSRTGSFLSTLASVWWWALRQLSTIPASPYADAILSPLLPALVVCAKCLFVFLVIVLVRVTTPKFKMETITKIGWLYSLVFIFLVLLSYTAGFMLF